MASKYVALLRGINVGRAKRIAMADLREVFESLGYDDVRTLLNSGNVVFTAKSGAPGTTAQRIETAISESLGVSSRVTVLSAAELLSAVTENPLLEVAVNHSRLLVTVLNDPADRLRLEPLARQTWGEDSLAIGTRVAYLWCATGILESKLNAAVSKALGDAATSRNWATVLKLHAMLNENQLS
jgi:uncharacterized protein (DUF1697 family)